MLGARVSNAIGVQERLRAELEADRGRLGELAQQLMESAHIMLLELRKTRLFAQYNGYFEEPAAGANAGDCAPMTAGDIKLVGEFTENSARLRAKAYELVLKKTGWANAGHAKPPESSKAMDLKCPEFLSLMADLSRHISLALDIGGTFVKVMFKLRPESHEELECLRDLFRGYMDTVYLLHALKRHWGVEAHWEAEPEGLRESTEFLKAIFLSIPAGDLVFTFKFIPVANLDRMLASIKGRPA